MGREGRGGHRLACLPGAWEPAWSGEKLFAASTSEAPKTRLPPFRADPTPSGRCPCVRGHRRQRLVGHGRKRGHWQHQKPEGQLGQTLPGALSGRGAPLCGGAGSRRSKETKMRVSLTHLLPGNSGWLTNQNPTLWSTKNNPFRKTAGGRLMVSPRHRKEELPPPLPGDRGDASNRPYGPASPQPPNHTNARQGDKSAD